MERILAVDDSDEAAARNDWCRGNEALVRSGVPDNYTDVGEQDVRQRTRGAPEMRGSAGEELEILT